MNIKYALISIALMSTGFWIIQREVKKTKLPDSFFSFFISILSGAFGGRGSASFGGLLVAVGMLFLGSALGVI